MKSRNSIHSAFLMLASSAVFTQISYSQTVEIDPVTPIPGSHTSIFATEWNTDGDTESWTANAQYTLSPGTPTGGQLTGTQGATNTDPNLNRSGLNLLSSPDTIIEFNITKDIADTSRIDLFWADDAGGIAAVRSLSINQPNFPTDGLPHTVRITFSGQLFGKLTGFRLDPSADVIGQGKTTSLDYFRVYSSNPTVLPLTWDPGITSGVTPGGAGDWDTATNRWWNGSSQVTWPVAPAGGNEAIFTGTAGAVSLPGPITARYLNFGTTGYSLTGTGPLTLAGPAVFRNSFGTHTTTIDVPIAGGATQTYVTGNYVFSKAGTQTGTTRLYNNATAITVDNPFGASSNKVIFGQGGNVFISSLGAGSERTIANNVDFVTNRLVINNNALGTGLSLLPLNITGNVLLNLPAPGDLYLRQNLTISGIVSGTGANAAIFFSGDVGTLTLNNTANTFTNNIRFGNSSILQVAADGSMGDTANILQFNSGSGILRLLSAFDSARPIVINNFGTGTAGTSTTLAQIDTNGFDSTWTGTISAPVFSAPAVAQQITTFVKQGAGTLTLDSGGTTANNLRSGGIRVTGGTLEIASGSITTGSATANGVSAGATLRLNGGTFGAGNFSVGLGTGTGTVTLDSGTLNNSAEFIVGWTGDGVFNVNGGLANLNNLSLTNAQPHTSTINLNGGEVRLLFFNARANAVTPAAATINFNGSQLQAKGNRTDFIETNTTTVITANVQAGGAKFDTNNFALTINQPLVHDAALEATLDGGLIKSGLGTLTLTAANTYTGPTSVLTGSLIVNGDNTAATGATSVSASAGLGGDGIINAATYADGASFPWTVADWTAAPSLSAGAVTIDGALTVVVGENALANFTDEDASFTILSASSLTVNNPAALAVNATAFTTGTGTWSVEKDGNTLKLVYTAGAPGYAAWAAAFSSPVLSPSGPTADADFDGLSNSVEYVTGSDPRFPSQANRPTSTTAAGVITFSFVRVDSSETPDVTTIVEVSSDLVDWTTLPSFTVGATTETSTAGVVVAENGAEADDITVTIPDTGATKKFARLTVVTTP